MRHNKRTDGNQKQIVSELKDRGLQVIITNFGLNFPDLLVGNHSWILVEVKEVDGCLDRGQLRFLASARGPVDVVTTADEVISGLMSGGLRSLQKDKIAAWLIKNPKQETLSMRKFRVVIGQDWK